MRLPTDLRQSPRARCLALTLALTCSTAGIPTARADDAKPARTPAPQPLPKADVTSPLGKQLQEKLDAIDREVTRLRSAGGKSAAYADLLARQIQPIRDRLDGRPTLTPAQAATPELHFVGLYEGDFPNGPKKYGRAIVQLDVTDRPVVLAVSAYSPIRWDVRLAPGVKLQKIIVSGYGDQTLDPAPADVPVEMHTLKGGDRENYFYTHEPDSAEYTRAAGILRNLTHLDVATFQGQYRFRGEPIVIGSTNNDWRLRRALADVEPLYQQATARDRAAARQSAPVGRFPALLWVSDGRMPMLTAKLADFTAVGPIEKSIRPLPSRVNRVAVDPRGPTWYAVDGHNLFRIDLAKNMATKLDIQGDLPELSWACGIAFDTKRNRLVMTSLGGVGYMYAYEPDKEKDQWSLVRDMANVDLESFTYSPAEDCFYGLVVDHSQRGALKLQRFTAAGTPDRTIALSGPISNGERSMGVLSPTQIVATGETTLVALAPPASSRGGGGGGGAAAPDASTMTLSVIDLKTGKVLQSQPARPAVEPRALAPDELDRRWLTLAGAATAADAEPAIDDLAAASDPAVALVRAKLPPPAARPDAAQVRQWLSQLDAPDWKARDAATAQLTAIGAPVRPDLEAALAANPPDERRTRLQAILRAVDAQAAAPATDDEPAAAQHDPGLRTRLRAIRLLSRIPTPDAVDLLRELASDSPDTLTATRAQSALRKL